MSCALDYDGANAKCCETVIVKSGVTTIEEKAFAGCDSLGNLTFEEPCTLRVIGKYAFDECVHLSSISIPETIEKIGEDAFWGCASMVGDIVIPSNLSEIGRGAFCRCSCIGEFIIKYPTSLKTLGSGAFQSSSLFGSIVLPPTLNTFGDSVFTETRITSIDFSQANITEIPMHTCNSCSMLKGMVVIPSTIQKIGTCAFRECSQLQGLDLSHCSNLQVIEM